MSNNTGSKIASTQNKPVHTNCYQWICVAAYYKAEARGFIPGMELEDWLAAETDYAKLMIKNFFLRCEEDGGISTAELQELGREIGLDHPEHLNTELGLVREIQKASHHRPCFQSKKRMDCKEDECQWRSECQKLIASWIQQ